ncbi:MAG: signal recognition particle-docking protein FtsY [Candidatus Aureabacteria bacterium]|nr:signal recognition particle-docking protein FtsY [Candidatus Auribacterota bacterium]
MNRDLNNVAEKGLFSRFSAGFIRTSQSIKGGLSVLFSSPDKKLEEEELQNLERVLIETDLGVDISMTLVDMLRHKRFSSREEVKAFIKQELLKRFSSSGRELGEKGKPRVVLFVGINGSGKTTSIAKIASLLQKKGKTVLLAAGDTFRAAAIEQLSIWAERLSVPIVRHKMGADPAAVAHDACESAKAKGIDYVLVDTAGRLHNQNALMEELKKVVRVISARVGEDALEKLLVIDGNAGQNSFFQARHFQESVRLDGIIITKLDGSAKGGVVVSIEEELTIPVKWVGLGESVDDIVPFSPDVFLSALLEEE